MTQFENYAGNLTTALNIKQFQKNTVFVKLNG